MEKQLKWYSFRWQTGIVILVLAAACWYYMAGRFMHPVGTGLAGPSVSLWHFKHVWSSGKVVLLGFGDSVTSGYGASEGRGYFDLLVKNDDTEYPDMQGRDLQHVFPNLKPVNYAESYTTSEEHLRDQIPWVKAFPPDIKGIVVITTGGNDIIHDYGRSPARDGAMYGCTYEQALEWRESFRKRLKAIVEGAMSKFPGGCEVFIANIYDPTDGVGDIQHAHLLLPRWPDGMRILDLFNSVIADVCASYPNVHLVDIHSEFLGHGIHCRNKRGRYYRANDPYYWYFKNLEDPNDRGYDAIRRIFLIEMSRAFEADREGSGSR